MRWIWWAVGAVVVGVIAWRLRDAFHPPASLRISQAGIDAIKDHEGWRPSIYLDAVGLPTIGYGHLIKPGEQFPKTLTPAEGEKLLRADVAEAEMIVQQAVTVPLTQGMYDALVSFVFNLGGGNLRSSTLLKKLNAGDYSGAAAEFVRWNKAGGRELAGLTKRRQQEAAIFTGGVA